MVFQNYALYPHMTVFDNMAFGLRQRHRTKDEINRRVTDAARTLGLESELNKKPRSLSGGQRQRVAMGRAIVREPQAFLMDEPLSNLDAKLRVEMRVEILHLQRRLKTTTMYVTHDQTEAMTMGDRVAVMRSGVLQQVAKPQELYEHPTNLFVAEFIGSPKMNLLEVNLDNTDFGIVAKFGSYSLQLGDRFLSEHPPLVPRVGSRVVLGIRPEDFSDASMERTDASAATLNVVPTLREDMGAEVLIHFDLGVPPFKHDAVTAATQVESVTVDQARALVVPFAARLTRETTAREGVALVLRVNTDRLYVFDPQTGDAI
jgi:multiple sugar transport system ATP-binding protein